MFAYKQVAFHVIKKIRKKKILCGIKDQKCIFSLIPVFHASCSQLHINTK